MAPPPGYVAYGGQGAALLPSMQPIGGISKALSILMYIMIPLQIIGAIATIGVIGKARDALNGRITYTEFENEVNGNLSSLSGLLVIPIAVLTIIWMYRMAANLRLLGRHGATWSPGWAIAGWFVPPFVIYAVPWLMFRELWKGSDPETAPGDPNWKQGTVSPLVNVWWVLYGLAPLVSIVTSAATIVSIMNTDSEKIAEAFDKFAAINIAMAFVGVAAGVVYVLLVRQLTARHKKAIHEA